MNGLHNLKFNQQNGEQYKVNGQSWWCYDRVVPKQDHNFFNVNPHGVLENIDSSTWLLWHDHKHIHVLPFSIIHEIEVIVLAWKRLCLEL